MPAALIWTIEEDKILKDLIQENKSYAFIAEQLGTKTANAVQVRVKRLGIKKPTFWVKEEDDFIIKSAKEDGLTFQEICDRMPNRTYNGVWDRARKLGLKGDNYNKEWEPWEDQLLIKLGKERFNYEDIMEYLPHRNKSAISHRYLRLVKSGKAQPIETADWTDEEIRVLEESIENGLYYPDIAELLDRKDVSAVAHKAQRLGINKNNWKENYLNLWQNWENELLIENYPKFELQEVQRRFLPHRTVRSCDHQVDQLNLEKRQYKTVYEDFFDKPNVLNSFVAGILAADGWVDSKNGKVNLSFSCKDYDFLLTIKELIGYSFPLRIFYKNTYWDEKFARFMPRGWYCAFSTYKTFRWVEKLNEHWNITPRKTYTLKGPNIQQMDLLFAYYAGLICGDGSIYFYEKEGVKTLNKLSINLVGTKFLLSFINAFLNKYIANYYNRKLVRTNSDKEVIKSLTISGIDTYFIGKIVQSLDLPLLERKWCKVDRFIQEVENNSLHQITQSNIKNKITSEIVNFLIYKNNEIPNYLLK